MVVVVGGAGVVAGADVGAAVGSAVGADVGANIGTSTHLVYEHPHRGPAHHV